MVLALGLLIFSFILTSILIVPFINLLYKLHFTRRKEAPKKGEGTVSVFDKLHDWKAGTPVGGGILLVAVISILYAAVFPLISQMGVFISAVYSVKDEITILFFTFISFALLGFYDDAVKLFGNMRPGRLGMIAGIGRKYKFTLQWILAFIVSYMIYDKLQISLIHIPIIDTVFNLGVFFIPFAALTIVSFANAFNITDGLDGLASGLLLICLFAFWIIASQELDTPLSIFISLWIGALIAFLYFNIWPARIFLGDSGSLSFGAMLGVIGLLTGKVFALIIIGGVFVFLAATSLIQILGWKFLERPIFPIAPAHHWFLLRGWEEPKIVMRTWLAGIILAIFGLWLAVI